MIGPGSNKKRRTGESVRQKIQERLERLEERGRQEGQKRLERRERQKRQADLIQIDVLPIVTC